MKEEEVSGSLSVSLDTRRVMNYRSLFLLIGMLCRTAKAKKSSRCIRFCPPGSRKAVRFPFSIQRRTVTLLTPQCLATTPVVRYSG